MSSIQVGKMSACRCRSSPRHGHRDRYSSYSPTTLTLITTLTLLVVSVSCRDCYKSNTPAEIPAYPEPDLIYQCPDDKSCCMENGDAACCGDGISTEGILENVALWGGLIGVCLIIGGIVYYFRSDIFVCDSTGKEGKTLRECCCLCCAEDESDRSQIADLNDIYRRGSSNSNFGSQLSVNGDPDRDRDRDPDDPRQLPYQQTITPRHGSGAGAGGEPPGARYMMDAGPPGESYG